jgi:hypothetical protein
VAGLLVAVSGLAGCSGGPGSGPVDAASFDAMSGKEHLACAVDISADTYLVAAGKVAEDKQLLGQSVLAVGWHHNAYAVPSGKGEQFGEINRRREEIMATDAPDTIMERAAACIAVAIAKSEAG